MALHKIAASPETVRYGVFDAAIPPVLNVASGDTAVLECVSGDERTYRQHAGNIDNKELVAGSTLFLPVWAPAHCFSAGDGHGVQGDGEVCINALESASPAPSPSCCTVRPAARRRCAIRAPRRPATSFRWA
jgi:acetamidase/formamidase